jgi:archaellum component FlaG (FlaF/FlaG flagellin family)
MKMLVVLLLLGTALGQPAAIRQLSVDSSISTIPLEDILSGGPPPQGIPALGFSGDHTGAVGESPAPVFISQQEATWLAEEEPVIVMSLAGENRIYPLQILTWHEIINDTLGGVPIAVTFCPLCNSALAFDRRVPLSEEGLERLKTVNANASITSLSNDFLASYQKQEGTDIAIAEAVEVTFGVSGMLYNSNMLMFDTSSSTLWSQLVGEAVVGTLTGAQLLRYPAPIVSFAEAKASFPDADVVSKETGFRRAYGSNPYVGYDRVGSPAFLFEGVIDGRLTPKERVITLEIGNESVAYPFSVISQVGVVNDLVGDEAIVVFWQAGTRSALDKDSIADSQDVGAANVFERTLEGQVLSFKWDGSSFIDEETSSTWNLLGQAVSGELKGKQLTPVVHDNTLWFAWASFRPETRIFEQ